MADSESPKTVFEFVFTRKEDPLIILGYDNNCNLQQYGLNREPEWFHKILCYVDEFHFEGHKNCSCEFSSANCHKLGRRNFSLAEQKNRRYFVHKMNKLEREKRALDVEQHDLEVEVRV